MVMIESRESRTGELSRAPQIAALAVALLLAVWGALYWIAGVNRHAPNLNRTEHRIDNESTARMLEWMDTLAGDEIPHPAGSKQNDVVRERLVDVIRSSGFEPEIHECENHPWRKRENPPVKLENILFRLPADQPAAIRRCLLVVSHYDSTPYGPGAGDATAGVVSLLNTARIMSGVQGRRHDVIFLVTDGEEFGLLGAERFAAEHPCATKTDLCINLEARGTSGPSLMFQTGDRNWGLAQVMQESLSAPRTSSLYDAIYRMLPNDTDFTVFLRNRIRGYNFAFIGDVKNYHTPDDKPENVDKRSLAHHACNLLELTYHLVTDEDAMETACSSQQEAVWFDLFGWKVISYPSWGNWLLGAGCLLAGFLRWPRVETGVEAGRFRKFLSFAGVHSGTWLLFLTIAISLVVTEFLLRIDSRMRRPWPDFLDGAILITGWAALAFCILVAGISWSHRRGGNELRWDCGAISFWGLTGALLAWQAPGTAWLFLVPGFCMAVAIVASRLVRRFTLLADFLPPVTLALSAGITWIWIFPGLQDAFGWRQPVIWPIVISFFLTSLLPLIARLDGNDRMRFMMGGVMISVTGIVIVVARSG